LDGAVLRPADRAARPVVRVPATVHGARDDGGSSDAMTSDGIIALDARPFDVVGLGVNALDLIAVIDGFPEPDAKHMIDEVEIQGGGMTATAMVACARLGLRARYVGKVGGDLWSQLALRLLRQDHVDIRGVIRLKDS